MGVEAITRVWICEVRGHTYELCNLTAADAPSHHVVQVGTPHGALQVCHERS